MGVVENVGFLHFPKQGDWVGKRVTVCFNYDRSLSIGGTIRHDREALRTPPRRHRCRAGRKPDLRGPNGTRYGTNPPHGQHLSHPATSQNKESPLPCSVTNLGENRLGQGRSSPTFGTTYGTRRRSA